MYLIARRSSASAVNAVTATGTSWMVSSRLRAVTVTAPSVVASDRVAVSGGAWTVVSCAHAAGASSAPATATARVVRLKRLRPISSSPRERMRTGGQSAIAGKTRGTVTAVAAVPSDNARGRRARRDFVPTEVGKGSHGIPDRAGGAGLPDAGRVPRLQRHPVRPGGRPGRGAADRPVAGRADVHRPVHGQDGRVPEE